VSFVLRTALWVTSIAFGAAVLNASASLAIAQYDRRYADESTVPAEPFERLPPLYSDEPMEYYPGEHYPGESAMGEYGVAAQGTNNNSGGMGMGLGDGGNRSPFRLSASWLPARTLKNAPGELTMDSQSVSLGVPLQIDERGIWLGLAGVERLGIGTSAAFPQTGLVLPDELWDIEFGVMRIEELGDGWRGGGMARVGSPSDRPFDSLRDMTVTLLAFVTIPSGERDAWSLSLFYSPTGQIVFPIPGVAYIWRPSDSFQMNIGIPFSFEYRPTDEWLISASYRPLTNVECLVRRSLGWNWSVYAAYRTVNETYWLSERTDDRERTYFYDQRVGLGLQRSLGPQWQLDFAASYVFDRQIFQAEKFSGDRNGELDIDPGLGATLSLSWNR
jgi:hypothetical protein